MNKHLIRSVSFVLTVIFPLSAFAREKCAPPIIVYPPKIAQQQQVNAAQEKIVNDLIDENIKLVTSAQNKQQGLDSDLHIFSDYGQYSKLRRVLMGYRDQIDLRDKLLASRDQRISDLQRQLDELKALSQKTSAESANANQLNQQLQATIDEINKKKADQVLSLSLLEEQSRQAGVYKEELKKANDRYDELVRKNENAKPIIVNKVVEKIVKEKDEETIALLEAKSKQLETFKAELEKTKTELTEVNTRYDAVRKELEAKPTVVEDTKKIDQLVQSLQDKTKEADQLGKDLADNSQRLADLKKDLQDKDERLINKDKEIAALKEQLRTAENEIKNLRAELAKDDVAFSTLKERGQALKQKLKDQEQALAEKDEFINEFKSQLAHAQNNVEEQNEKINSVQQELGTKYSDLKSQADAYAKVNADLQKKLDATNLDQAKINESNSQLKAKLEEKDADLQKELEAKSVNQNKIDELRKTAELQTVKAQGLQQELDQLNIRFKDLESKGADLQKESEAKNLNQAKIDELTSTIAQKDQQLELLKQNLERTVTETQRIIDEQKANAAIVREQLTKTEQNFSAAQERLRLIKEIDLKHRQRIALLEEKNALIVKSISKVEGKVEQSTSLAAAMKGQYEQKIDALTRSIAELERNTLKLNDDIAAKKAEKDQVYGLLDKFKNRLKETADVTEDQAKAIAAYRAKIDQLNRQLANTSQETQLKEARVMELRQNLDAIKSEADEVAQENKAKDLTMAMVQSKMDEGNKVHEALVAQLKDQMKLSADELSSLREKLTVAEARLSQSSKGDDVSRLQDMLKSSREEIIQLNYLLKQKEMQIKGLQDGLDVNSSEFIRQSKALEGLKNDLDKQHAAILKLKEDLSWKEKEITRLKVQAKGQKPVDAAAAQVKVAVPSVQKTEVSLPSDYPNLKQALKDANEQIRTLKDKLRLKQEAAIKDNPAFSLMTEEIKKLKSQLSGANKERDDILKALKECEGSVDPVPYAQ